MSTLHETKPKDINTFSQRDEQNPASSLLEAWGFDGWFQQQSNESIKDDFSVARVVEVNKNNFLVCNGQHEIFAEVSGKFMYHVESSMDLPTVGDWVVIQCFDHESLAIIHSILPRKTVLKRKDPGKAVEFQLIAANIDYAFILQSVDANLNFHRLERYLVMVNESRIQAIVVLTKTDLISAEALAEINDKIKRFQDRYLFLPISHVTDEGLNALQSVLVSGKTYCLLGSSGVGKTTLLNKLLGEELFEVNEVRGKDSKGKHTTVKRQLIRLESGSLFIDTPGLRELGNFAVDDGLEETFAEVVSYSSQCRFKDCTHTHEEGCAVLEAVMLGTIEKDRYQNYLKIQKESAYYAMSHLDKRRKDKAFGRFMKNYKKSIRKK